MTHECTRLETTHLQQDGAWYVIDELGECISPPMPTRESAWDLAVKIEALDPVERAQLRAGLIPAPGCEFLIPMPGRVRHIY